MYRTELLRIYAVITTFRLRRYCIVQGGGQALAFATRPHPPPSKDTLALLSGVIGGGACIRLTSPKPWVMVRVHKVLSLPLPVHFF